MADSAVYVSAALAELLLQTGALHDAHAMAFKAVRISPFSALNQHLLGSVLVAQKKPAEAVEYFNYATELQPEVASYWADLALAQNAAGRAAAAKAAAEHAVKLDPGSVAGKLLN